MGLSCLISIFDNLCVTLGDFTIKLNGNLYLAENQLSRNEMCHKCANEFLDANFNLAVINKI